ncbi:NAD(P)H-dependent oxidoreductase [Patescibacteria group bacterium]|nr:NAD(P)H-dependent oxidoreductase [Patescibacteria group bacterium]MCG2694936.1 NAD(P)H-dependent oxidoreductase [Candidatus Parcubacteria bacterium]
MKNNSDKKILVILGHPRKNSFCGALVEAYVSGVRETENKIEILYLRELNFSLILKNEGKNLPAQEFEPCLADAQAKIKWADHLVFVYPTWWSSMPALLKGFIDRVFASGFAFKYREKSMFPEKLLKGKTMRLIVTMDCYPLLYKWFLGNVHKKEMRNLANFCGIASPKTIYFGPVGFSTVEKRKKWLVQIHKIGKND